MPALAISRQYTKVPHGHLFDSIAKQLLWLSIAPIKTCIKI